MNFNLAPQQVDVMVDSYRQGSTLAQIAKVTGYSTSHVFQVLKRQGLTRLDKGSAKGGLDGKVASMHAFYQTGKTLAEVGDAFGLTRQRVFQIFKERSLLRSDNSLKHGGNPEQVQAMIDMYRDGKTLAQVGLAFGLSGSHVHQVFKNHGITKKDKGTNHGGREALVTMMLTLYQEGRTLAEIGEAVGLSRQRVHQVFKARGINSEGMGAKARAQARRNKTDTESAKRIAKTWDMTMDEYQQHVAVHGSSGTAGSPMNRYVEQRSNCKRKKGKWEFTFKTWWDLWVQSGKWEERGLGGYVLGRVGDASTPMGPKTCKITTVSDIICGDFFSRG